jgi:hypothetical protein
MKKEAAIAASHALIRQPDLRLLRDLGSKVKKMTA